MPFTMTPPPLKRIEPKGPVSAYKTYAATAPVKTHWRPATCEEVRCDAYRSGWVTTVDLATELGQRQAHFIKNDKTRGWSMQRVGPTVVKFVFGPGQKCFAADGHLLPNNRLSNYLVIGGDWRGNPRGERRRHKNGLDWAEDCAEHVDRINTALERG
jgi:hypothetical protein